MLMAISQNDAFKSERDVDRALDERGITDAEQDVEFGSA
jgi:phosphohistidine phosphatase SixA